MYKIMVIKFKNFIQCAGARARGCCSEAECQSPTWTLRTLKMELVSQCGVCVCCVCTFTVLYMYVVYCLRLVITFYHVLNDSDALVFE